MVRSIVFAVVLFIPCFLIFINGILQYVKNYSSQLRVVGGFNYGNDLVSILAIPKDAFINIYMPFIQDINEKIIFLKGTNITEYVSVNPGILETILFFIVFFIVFRKRNIDRKNKILIWVIGIYYFLSFGKLITFFGHFIFRNFFYDFIEAIPIFYVLRTPGRFTMVMISFMLIFIFSNLPIVKRRLVEVLILPCVLLYVFMFKSDFTFFPEKINFHEYTFKHIKDDPGAVLNIPISLGREGYYNFLQLQHGQKIIAGLVPYIVQTDTAVASISNNILLRNLSCRQILPEEQSVNGALYKKESVLLDLNKYKIKYIFIHHDLLAKPECKSLYEYVYRYLLVYIPLEELEKGSEFSVFKLSYPYISRDR
jgi:hypothetical protein